MHQFYADVIDQLDLALDQLAVSDRNFDRFALLLIDNVVELTLHQYFRDKAGENELWQPSSDPQFDPRIVHKGLGRNFSEKAKGAKKLGLIDGSVCESLITLHLYRNTSYHQGLRHEGILHSLAVFYFRITCDLLLRYDPHSYGWGSDDVVSHRARKYLGPAAERPSATGHPTEAYRRAFQQLLYVSQNMDCNLIGDLADDLSRTIQATDELIDFLAENGPKKVTRDQAVIEAQAWSVAFTDEARALAQERSYDPECVQDFVSWVADNCALLEHGDPIARWNKRLATLAKETDEHKALKRYSDFIIQTEDSRDCLLNAAMALEQYIDEQIDRMRGL